MFEHPNTIVGVADGGAHVNILSEASCCTYLLTHWVRDRSRGEKLSIEAVVKAQSCDTARLFGMHDRGTLELGMRADINVIDLPRLRIHRPELADDLPTGARRWIQNVSGYKLTMVNGVVTYEDGKPTGALPGKLVRNTSTGAKRANGS